MSFSSPLRMWGSDRRIREPSRPRRYNSLVTTGLSDTAKNLKDARVAGLRGFSPPTLESVERRRSQLWTISGVMILAFAVGMALLSFDNSVLETFDFLPSYLVRVLIVGFAATIGLYLANMESRLAKLTRALVNERVLSAALSNRLKEVSLLSEVGKAINQVLDLNDVLQMILSSATELLDAEEGSIMLVDSSSDDLVISNAHTIRDLELTGTRVKMGQGVAGWVASHREPLLITGPARPEFFNSLEDDSRVVSSALSVPLIRNDELCGVLNVSDVTGEREFSEYDLRALGLFAEHAAIAIGNAQAYDKERTAVVRMEEIDRIKTEFIATVSHELRTPLTSIIGCAKTLRRRSDALSEDQRLDFLQMIESQGVRLLRMVEEILSTSRIESEESPLRRELVEIDVLTREIVQRFETAGAKNPLRLSSTGSVVAFGDPMVMEQIISNLVENAIKYSESNTPVDIEVTDSLGNVEIKVVDRGFGIPESDLNAIFERFRQVDQSSTRVAGGVGLGLYLVKKMVESHGGTILVESKVGEGSTFMVRFPKRKN